MDPKSKSESDRPIENDKTLPIFYLYKSRIFLSYGTPNK